MEKSCGLHPVNFTDANARLALPIGCWLAPTLANARLAGQSMEQISSDASCKENSNETSAAVQKTDPVITKEDANHEMERDSQLVSPRDLVYKQLVMSKGYEYLGYKFPLYTRCELRENFHLVTYFDGTIVDRPAETVFRPGQEVFLCPQQRIKAMGKIFIVVGFMPTNLKMPSLCHTVLLDKSAFELRKGVDEFKELLIFRTCPIKHIGKVPDGRTFEETEAILTEIEPVLRAFFDNIAVSGEDLSAFDFVEITKPNSVSVKDPLSENNLDSKPRTRGSAKTDKQLSSPVNRKQIISVSTPPYARNIANQISQLSHSVCKVQKLVSTITANSNKNETNSAKQKKIAQARDELLRTVKTLQKENCKLSAEVSELTVKNAAQAAEIAALKSNNHNSAVHMQMPPYFPYHTMFPPPAPLHTNQHQQSFAFSNPIPETANTQFPPTAATVYGHVSSHKKALKHSSRKKSRSKRYRSSTDESGSESK